ncbi:MAG: hypothetical protein QOJ15_1177 [Bradyrhizobium sp.]|nr:hypothetical protein [Bradyrhizobium sp.]
MLAILAWHSIQRHIDCQKRNVVSGPVANRIEREALILVARRPAPRPSLALPSDRDCWSPGQLALREPRDGLVAPGP